MEHHANFRYSNTKYSKISLKVRIDISSEAATAGQLSFGEKPTCVQDGKETSSQPLDCQAHCQKIQGRRNILRVQGRYDQKTKKRGK